MLSQANVRTNCKNIETEKHVTIIHCSLILEVNKINNLHCNSLLKMPCSKNTPNQPQSQPKSALAKQLCTAKWQNWESNVYLLGSAVQWQREAGTAAMLTCQLCFHLMKLQCWCLDNLAQNMRGLATTAVLFLLHKLLLKGTIFISCCFSAHRHQQPPLS